MDERFRVKLTLQQAEQVEWAIAPMADHWCTEDGAHGRDGAMYHESTLPVVTADGTRKTSRMLELSEVAEINADLLYRLEEQLAHMAREEFNKAADKDAKAARNAAARIRHRLKHAGVELD